MAKTATKTTAPKKVGAPALGRAAKKAAVPGFTARSAKEITATFPNGIGVTAKVAAALAAANVNILAGTGYSGNGIGAKATFTLIVDDLVKAEKALDKIGADDVQDSSIVMVETVNQVGALERISRLIADAGIDIYYFYSTTSTGKTAICIFKTADDKRTIKVLNEA